MGDPAEQTIELTTELEEFIEGAVDDRMRSMVNEAVEREEQQRFRQFKWIAAFVGIVGLGTFGTLSNYLIEKAVESKIEARAGNISEALDFAKFYTLTLKLELGEEFSPDDRDAIMTFLRKASKNDRVRLSPEFMAGLFEVTRAFASANQAPSLDEIFNLFEREILASPLLVEALLHHYGQDLAGRSNAPADDVSLTNFEKLERISAASRVPELALYYRILLEFQAKPESDNVEVIELLRRVPDLTEPDVGRFLFEILTHSDADNWQTVPQPGGIELEKTTRTLLNEFRDTWVNELGLEPDVLQAAIDGGIDDAQARAIGRETAQRLKASKGA